MHKELLARGIQVGKERVRRLIQQHGIKVKTKRKFVVTTDCRHSLTLAADLVQQGFNPGAPNQFWCGDITYLATDEGWLYLAAVIDLHSRQVVGWSLQPHMHTGLVKDELAMAWWRRRQPEGMLFLIERDSQYISHEFQQALKGWGIRSRRNHGPQPPSHVLGSTVQGRVHRHRRLGALFVGRARRWYRVWRAGHR